MRVLAFDVGIKNMAYCVINGSHDTTSIEQWDVINIQNSEEAPSIEECVTLTIDALRGKRDELLAQPLDSIIIEQQPAGGHNVHANVKVKIVSHAIQAFFYMAGIAETTTISFVSPVTKLKDMKKDIEDAKFVIEMAGADATEGKKMKSRYTRNKKYAIFKTNEILNSVLDGDMSREVFRTANGKKQKESAPI